jgi:hypothetical protein
MKKVNDFLGRFLNLTPPDLIVKKVVSLGIKNTLGIEIDIKNISFVSKTGYVFVKIDSIKKSMIFLQKENLLKEINNKIGRVLVRDIK